MKLWVIFFTSLVSFTLGGVVVMGMFPLDNEDNEPVSECTYTRCPYYEAPTGECRTVSETLPTRLISQRIKDTEEGLIQKSHCGPVEE
jgi:hypothetical protein